MLHTEAEQFKQPAHSLLNDSSTANILIVEDDFISMSFLESQIQGLGHHIYKAENGKEALDALNTNNGQIDIVLMDREMPVMDGISTVRNMKDNPAFKKIPVIMVTGADELEEMKEGLDAGVFYYLTKPVEDKMLQSVLSAALREVKNVKTLAKELGKHKSSIDLISSCKFEFKTLEQAEGLAAFMANCFPNPEKVVIGLGELLINAIEHGNLGLGYDKKGELLESGIWRSEINRIQAQPENRDKFAEAIITHKDDGTYVVITDCGKGFDWQNYMNVDPSRAGESHGRGIAQARIRSFDKVGYNKAGNKVVAFSKNMPDLNW